MTHSGEYINNGPFVILMKGIIDVKQFSDGLAAVGRWAAKPKLAELNETIMSIPKIIQR